MNRKLFRLFTLLALVLYLVSASQPPSSSSQTPGPPTPFDNEEQTQSEPIATTDATLNEDGGREEEEERETVQLKATEKQEEESKEVEASKGEDKTPLINEKILEEATIPTLPQTVEKSILQINCINFYNSLSRKIFYGLLGEATTLLPPNNTHLTNIYERNQSQLLLSVKENQYQVEYYDVVLLYLDTFTFVNDEILLKRLIQSIQTLKLPQNNTMETRSNPVLKIVFNGPKDSVKRLFSFLDEAFNSYYDYYGKGSTLPPTHEELQALLKKSKKGSTKLSSSSYIRSYSGDVNAISNLINFEVLYLPISSELEAQPTIPLFSTVIEKILRESENNTIPYHAYLQREEDIGQQRPLTASHGQSVPSQRQNDTAEGILRLKAYQRIAIQHTLTEIITPEILEKLNVNYVLFQSLRSFGKAIDNVLDKMFAYYHDELISKDPLLAKHLSPHLPWIRSPSSEVGSSTTDPYEPLVAIYHQQTYELFSSMLQRLIPFYNKQLQLLEQKKAKEYDAMISEHDVELSLSFAADLEEKRKEVLADFNRQAQSLLPIKYYHALLASNSQSSRSAGSPLIRVSPPSLGGVKSLLSFKRGKEVEEKVPAPATSITTPPTSSNTASSSSHHFLRKNPYFSRLTFPITNLWSLPELFTALSERFSATNHRIVTHYQSIQVLPHGGRKPIDISFHMLLNHPLGFRDYRQDPLLFDTEKDQVIFYDLNQAPLPTTRAVSSKKGADGSGSVLGQLSPSAVQTRQRLQQQIEEGSGPTGQLKKKSEFAREMLMLPLSVKPYRLPFSSRTGNRRRGSGRPKKDTTRQETGPERFIRWDIEPMDEVKENLELLEQSQPPPSALDKFFNIFPSMRSKYYRHSTYNYGEDYEPPVPNEDDEEEEISVRERLKRVAAAKNSDEDDEDDEEDDGETGEIEDIGEKVEEVEEEEEEEEDTDNNESEKK